MFVVVGSATCTCINIWSDPNVLLDFLPVGCQNYLN